MLKAGDVVELKSGGPTMTIEWIDNRGAMCLWFDGSDAKQKLFSVASLVKADD
jgi:uncharacterized protein YodC (DUF2158 family)